MKLIDAGSMKEFMSAHLRSESQKQYIYGLIDMMPTVDAEPVIHAYWENVQDMNTNDKYCTSCGCRESIFSYNHEIYQYCPHCGAKMDLEAEK